MRHQIDVAASTIDDLSTALIQLRTLGAPDTAQIRVRTRASFNADGGLVRAVTVRWTTDDTDDAAAKPTPVRPRSAGPTAA